jgi:hypothetical protein
LIIRHAFVSQRERERKRERKVSFGGAKQKKSVHLLVFYDNNDVSRLIIEMYTHTHSSEKMVIFASFFALPTMAALFTASCAYIKINRAYTFLSQPPTLRPAKTSFVTCNAFNVYSFMWFCRAIARSSSPRSSFKEHFRV